MRRCSWAKSDAEIIYHDEEWCVPTHDDCKIFEFLVLEGAQAGLSWRTILERRAGYRKAFAGFDPRAVSRYGKRDEARLASDASIIRNRLKIRSAISNARRFLEVQAEFGTFERYLWGFVGGRQVRSGLVPAPATSPESEALSQNLKSRGFTFAGPLICYSLMQATGLINDHEPGCFLYRRTL